MRFPLACCALAAIILIHSPQVALCGFGDEDPNDRPTLSRTRSDSELNPQEKKKAETKKNGLGETPGKSLFRKNSQPDFHKKTKQTHQNKNDKKKKHKKIKSIENNKKTILDFLNEPPKKAASISKSLKEEDAPAPHLQALNELIRLREQGDNLAMEFLESNQEKILCHAMILMSHRKFKEAELFFESISAISKPATFRLAFLYLCQGMIDKAWRIYNELKSGDKRNLDYQLSMARISEYKSHFQDALDLYQSLLDSPP